MKVAAEIRELRRAGKPTAPRWQLLSHRIAEALATFMARPGAAA